MNGSTALKPGRLEFISFLRVFGMVCILLCHYVQEIPNALIQSTAQIFNIGFPLFFIISGFCFGLQGEIQSPGKWYAKRLKRIFIPYEIFLLMYFIVFLILGKKIHWGTWGIFVLGIQGNYFKIPGIEQTWFITPLLLCYLITPLASAAAARLKKGKLRVKIIVIISAAAVYAVVCFNPSDNLYVIASPVVFYIGAYLWGRDYKREARSFKAASVAILTVVLSFGVRFCARYVFDGTMLYSRFISGVTHYIAAFGIFMVFEYLFRNAGENRLIRKADSISFEVYLCHYLFLRGALILVDFTPYKILNLVIVTAVTIITAYVIHGLSSLVQKKINQ